MRSRMIDLSKENEIKKSEPNKLQVHFDEHERTSGLQLNGTGISKPGCSINVRIMDRIFLSHYFFKGS